MQWYQSGSSDKIKKKEALTIRRMFQSKSKWPRDYQLTAATLRRSCRSGPAADGEV